MFFTGVIGPVRDAFTRAHLTGFIGEDHFFLSNQQAVDAFIEHAVAREFKPYALQTNAKENGVHYSQGFAK